MKNFIEAFEVKYRYQLIKKIGLNNKDKLKSKLVKLKSSFNFKRLSSSLFSL